MRRIVFLSKPFPENEGRKKDGPRKSLYIEVDRGPNPNTNFKPEDIGARGKNKKK